MMKKYVITAILTFMFFTSVDFPAYAAELPAPITAEEPNIISPTAEQTEWYFRYNEEGVLQRRLWSLTYQKWLTDWMDV